MDYIRANGIKAPEGGLALPLPYTVYERPTYSVVPSNALWRDPARVGETTRFTNHPDHEWYWFPQQKPTEVSMLKCYDSVTDGSVSRWSFHTACIDPTAPDDAPCRKNVVVRAFVFF